MSIAKRNLLFLWHYPSQFNYAATPHYLRSPNFHLRACLGSNRQCWAESTRLERKGLCVNAQIYHTSSRLSEEAPQPTQAQPLSGYYAEILSTGNPQNIPKPAATARVNAAKLETKEDRARVVFGSRLAGSGYERRSSETPDSTWRTINGVPVPPRPAEPDNCCMSGCVHCVWDDYRDEVEDWAGRLREAQAKGLSSNCSNQTPGVSSKAGISRREVAAASASMDDDGGGSETNWDGSGPDELFAGIPVGIREFMRTEKRLRERRRAARGGR